MEASAITAAAQAYLPAMSRFLRELIAIPGESCREEQVCRRVEQEMLALGYDRVKIDPLGNVLGFIGQGPRLIAYDGHIDTVGVGEMANWRFDPYQGYENQQEIGGRGASDQLGGIVAAVYGGKIVKDLHLLPDGYQILVSGTVQEEDCDGLCWQYIIEEDGLRPEFVVVTEPTDGHIYRGQRGRMEIRVEVKGLSCHGSAPERGDNAIYKMAEILPELQDLHQRLAEDAFLGKGSLAVSQIFFQSPSRCAVADMCAVSIDRRLTWGETWQNALDEIAALPAVQRHQAQVSLYRYEAPSWRGLVYPSDCYFPAWVVPPEHPAVQAAAASFRNLYQEPEIGKWTFSTNGVSIMGRYGIPCVGLGPGREDQAHAANEITWKADLVRCAAVYAGIPQSYADLVPAPPRK